jgi:hypothetical protein
VKDKLILNESVPFLPNISSANTINNESKTCLCYKLVGTLKLQDSLQGFNAAYTILEIVLSTELQYLHMVGGGGGGEGG